MMVTGGRSMRPTLAAVMLALDNVEGVYNVLPTPKG